MRNYIHAINFAIKELENIPLSNRLLKDTQRTLMQGVRGESKQSGEFRISQYWIGVSLGNAVFTSPQQEEITDLMSDNDCTLPSKF